MPIHLYPSFHHVTYDIRSLHHNASFVQSPLSAFPAPTEDVIAELLVPICNDEVTRLLNEQALHLRTVATELLRE